MRDIDRLKERYPKSDPYEINDSFENGFSAGFTAGYKEASEHWQEECRQLRECLHALLVKEDGK